VQSQVNRCALTINSSTKMGIYTIHTEPINTRYRAHMCSMGMFFQIVMLGALLVIPYSVSYATGGEFGAGRSLDWEGFSACVARRMRRWCLLREGAM
jgi:hypothetical protein